MPAGGPWPAARRPAPSHDAGLREICATLEAENYPHLLRVWNYLRTSIAIPRHRALPEIQHRTPAGATRVRPLAHGKVPAASRSAPPATVPGGVFPGWTHPPTFLENPRQVSAYHYPRQYGLTARCSRAATLLRRPEGLASVHLRHCEHRGSQIAPRRRQRAQTRETLANIEALLAEANRVARGARFELGALLQGLRAPPADLPVIKAELAAALGAGTRLIYLQRTFAARICWSKSKPPECAHDMRTPKLAPLPADGCAAGRGRLRSGACRAETLWEF